MKKVTKKRREFWWGSDLDAYLENAAKNEGDISAASYIRRALKNALIADGYIKLKIRKMGILNQR